MLLCQSAEVVPPILNIEFELTLLLPIPKILKQNSESLMSHLTN